MCRFCASFLLLILNWFLEINITWIFLLNIFRYMFLYRNNWLQICIVLRALPATLIKILCSQCLNSTLRRLLHLLYLVTTNSHLFYLFVWTWDSVSLVGEDRDPWLLSGYLIIFFFRILNLKFVHIYCIWIFYLFKLNFWLNIELFWGANTWFLFNFSGNDGWWWFCRFILHWRNRGLIPGTNLSLRMYLFSFSNTGPFGIISNATNIDVILNWLLDAWYIQIHILSSYKSLVMDQIWVTSLELWLALLLGACLKVYGGINISRPSINDLVIKWILLVLRYWTNSSLVVYHDATHVLLLARSLF